MARLKTFRIKAMWGNFSYDFSCSLLRGRSGDILSVWDPTMFVKERIWCGDHYVIVKGKWVQAEGLFFVVNIYGPQDMAEKLRLWNFLLEFKSPKAPAATRGPVRTSYIIFGDFNEVREEADRFGSFFNAAAASHFNNFNNEADLLDVPLGGRRFTWMNKTGTKMSLIDRVLISQNVAEVFPDAKVEAFNRVWSDHVPLFFHVESRDFGPTPFKIFYSWFQRDGFKQFVQSAWKEDDMNVSLLLKKKIKQWIANNKNMEKSHLVRLKERVHEIEIKIKNSCTSPEELDERTRSLSEMEDLVRFEDMDLQ
ncbi:uncharacterized protein [Rutidosis leptorrhynchoides]|uniref:uncharacterized protein n=1 Tax=Rutidosis leptorrhynchoides TaxID=125765 RepID=UPI003A99F080